MRTTAKTAKKTARGIILSGDRTAIERLLAKAPLLHIRRFAVFCALDALATTRCSDVRLHLAVQTIRRYVEGEATREELQRVARYAARAAGAAWCADTAAWYAARAAGEAGAAWSAVDTAGYAVGAAHVAAGAGGAARRRQADAWARITRGEAA